MHRDPRPAADIMREVARLASESRGYALVIVLCIAGIVLAGGHLVCLFAPIGLIAAARICWNEHRINQNLNEVERR